MESATTRSDTPSPPPVGFLIDSSDQKETFRQRGFDLDNPQDSHRRARSRSSSNPRPASSTKSNPDEESSEEKRPVVAPLQLPPVPTSKPTTPELPPSGKVVRRRSFQKKTLERNASTVESSPALVRRHSTIGEGEALRRNNRMVVFEGDAPELVRRSTIDSVGDNATRSRPGSPASAPMSPATSVRRSASTGKIIRRAKTIEAPEDKKLARRTSMKTKEESEAGKIEALKALVASKCGEKGSLVDVLNQLTRNVLKYHGTKAFGDDHAERAIANIQRERSGSIEQCGSLEREAIVIQALESMSKEIDMGFSDVVGQILWRFRNVGALKDKKSRKDAAEDISWAAYRSVDDQIAMDVIKSVDDVFDMFESVSKGKGITFNAWQRVTKFVECNPVLKRRVWLTDIDRLWYAATHKPHMDPQTTIGRRGFKELLLNWCDAMNVHPWMVFVAIGSRSGDIDYSDGWQKLNGAAKLGPQS